MRRLGITAGAWLAVHIPAVAGACPQCAVGGGGGGGIARAALVAAMIAAPFAVAAGVVIAVVRVIGRRERGRSR